MRRFLRENSLSIFFLVIFLAALTGQAIAGHDLYNEETLSHGGDPISLWRYVTSSSFGQAVMENWQSEYLQFTLFVLATVWLLQRGSPESRSSARPGASRIGSSGSAHTLTPAPRCGHALAGSAPRSIRIRC
jgi:hypothetical protein